MIMATMANNDRETSQPTCQNCSTSTTPLWRRDEIGSVLCNACGLFLKLHGRARPISLKTDVIKSRNRVKSSGAGQGPKKKASQLQMHLTQVPASASHPHRTAALLANPLLQSLFDTNGLEQNHSTNGTPPPPQNTMAQRRPSQQNTMNGHSEGSNSPISRTVTPSMYHIPTFNNHPFDGYPHPQHSPSLPAMNLRQPSPGRSASPLNGVNGLELPQTYEQLIAQNAAFKTRVSELEVINELFRGRVTELGQDASNANVAWTISNDNWKNLMVVRTCSSGVLMIWLRSIKLMEETDHLMQRRFESRT